MRWAGSLLILAVLVGNGGSPARDASTSSCSFGLPASDRALITPKRGTFYSVDVLNPDIVRWRGRYLMFFSGNREHTPAGNWRTGLAVARSPTGPFRMTSLSLPYLNGGTVAWRGRLWQATARSVAPGGSDLLVSRDGLRWRKVASIPQRPGAYKLTADYALEALGNRLRLYAIGRLHPPGLASHIITLDYLRGRWIRHRTLLRPGPALWESVDLGEPYPLRWKGRRWILYTGTAPDPYARGIGLAINDRGRWRRCGSRPLLPPGSAPWGRSVSIDPDALVIGRRVYVYYGGGDGTSIASDLAGAIGVRTYE